MTTQAGHRGRHGRTPSRDAAKTDIPLTTRLATATGSDPHALPANRAGRLTPEQQRQLRARLRAARRGSLVPTACCLLAVGVFAYGLGTGSLDLATESSVAVFALVTGWVGLLRPHHGRLRRRIDAGVVTCVEGRLTGEREGWPAYQLGGESSSCYFVLGKRRFLVSAEAYDALVDGRCCRIYYLPDTPTDRGQLISPMVNIEAVTDSG